MVARYEISPEGYVIHAGKSGLPSRRDHLVRGPGFEGRWKRGGQHEHGLPPTAQLFDVSQLAGDPFGSLRASMDTSTATDAALFNDLGLAVLHANGFGGTTTDTGITTFAKVLQRVNDGSAFHVKHFRGGARRRVRPQGRWFSSA